MHDWLLLRAVKPREAQNDTHWIVVAENIVLVERWAYGACKSDCGYIPEDDENVHWYEF